MSDKQVLVYKDERYPDFSIDYDITVPTSYAPLVTLTEEEYALIKNAEKIYNEAQEILRKKFYDSVA